MHTQLCTFKYGYSSKENPWDLFSLSLKYHNSHFLQTVCKEKGVSINSCLTIKAFFSWELLSSSRVPSVLHRLKVGRNFHAKMWQDQALCCSCMLVVGTSPKEELVHPFFRSSYRVCEERIEPMLSHPSTTCAQSFWLKNGIVTEKASDLWAGFKEYLMD